MKISTRKLVVISLNVWETLVVKEQIEKVVGEVVDIVGKSICHWKIARNWYKMYGSSRNQEMSRY